jgi:hypothetical protein
VDTLLREDELLILKMLIKLFLILNVFNMKK